MNADPGQIGGKMGDENRRQKFRSQFLSKHLKQEVDDYKANLKS